MSDINVFTGPMKSGKSQKIINEAYRQMIAGKKIQMFKPKLDTRDYECVADRNGNKLTAININDVEEIKSYFEDFEGWGEFEDYKEHYDFKCEWIDTADYFYIESKDEFNKYESYNVYFFDVQTSVLYFIHSNI